MPRWQRGEAEIESLIAAGDLQKLTGEAANGKRLLRKAVTTLETAGSAIENDPDSAFVLAYDASRQAMTALLAHQGLRPTTKGGHYAVQQASRAQFGSGSASSVRSADGANELEYPEGPGDDANADEAAEAVDAAKAIIAAAESLLDELGLF